MKRLLPYVWVIAALAALVFTGRGTISAGISDNADSLRARIDRSYARVHAEAIVADGHNDVLGSALRGNDLTRRRNQGHSDLPRFREGGLDVQVFSIWVPPSQIETRTAFQYARRMIDSLDAVLYRARATATLARSGTELRAAVASGRFAAVIGIEGGHAAQNSLASVRELYRRGMRCFGLTWNNSNAWAASAQDEVKNTRKGLSREGKTLVRMLDSLGVVIDVSHAGPATVRDVLATTRNPILASHSACASLRRSPRNLTDDQLRAIAAGGGVVMVNFFPGFLKAPLPPNVAERCIAEHRALLALRPAHGVWDAARLQKRDARIRAARARGLPTLLDVVDHIEHAARVAGVAHVGLGSDFDGIDYAPVGLGDVTELPFLTRELLLRGFSESDVRNILGANFARLFSAVCR